MSGPFVNNSYFVPGIDRFKFPEEITSGVGMTGAGAGTKTGTQVVTYERVVRFTSVSRELFDQGHKGSPEPKNKSEEEKKTLSDTVLSSKSSSVSHRLLSRIEMEEMISKATTLCIFFLRGKCASKCSYGNSHDLNIVPVPMDPRKPVCKIFQETWQCPKGASCNYSHDINFR